ncbi:MAG: hypothetical protein K2X82_15950 [Gemmataceae bacterium]|nr:hypothetical protein [Gemmataceae bacterium]
MTAGDTITDLLSAPLAPDWTVEGLAEDVLRAVAARPVAGPEIAVAVDDSTDRQTRRLIRPLLAYLAARSAAEAGTPANLYGGRLAFNRPGPTGPVWVVGEFENRPGRVRLALRRIGPPAPSDETRPTPPGPSAGESARPGVPLGADADRMR